jgi:hypothetical protein
MNSWIERVAWWIERAWFWFTKAGQFWLLQTMLIYLWACLAAGKPIGPKDFIKFIYHTTIAWQPGPTVTIPADLSER